MAKYFHSRMAELTIKYLTDKLTGDEKAELNSIIDSAPEKRKLFEKLTDENYYLWEALDLGKGDVYSSWKELKPRLDLVPDKLYVWICLGRWLRKMLAYACFSKRT